MPQNSKQLEIAQANWLQYLLRSTRKPTQKTQLWYSAINRIHTFELQLMKLEIAENMCSEMMRIVRKAISVNIVINNIKKANRKKIMIKVKTIKKKQNKPLTGQCYPQFVLLNDR